MRLEGHRRGRPIMFQRSGHKTLPVLLLLFGPLGFSALSRMAVPYTSHLLTPSEVLFVKNRGYHIVHPLKPRESKESRRFSVCRLPPDHFTFRKRRVSGSKTPSSSSPSGSYTSKRKSPPLRRGQRHQKHGSVCAEVCLIATSLIFSVPVSVHFR